MKREINKVNFKSLTFLCDIIRELPPDKSSVYKWIRKTKFLN